MSIFEFQLPMKDNLIPWERHHDVFIWALWLLWRLFCFFYRFGATKPRFHQSSRANSFRRSVYFIWRDFWFVLVRKLHSDEFYEFYSHLADIYDSDGLGEEGVSLGLHVEPRGNIITWIINRRTECRMRWPLAGIKYTTWYRAL